MKPSLFQRIFLGVVFFAVAFFGATAIAASTGVIDPNNAGNYKAAFLDTGVMTDTGINFGKFTTESNYNITVSDTELRGYAWGSSVGYMVMNCADTTSGCSSTNGNFKVANSNGALSGYAWGENTGWINFGPFTTPGVSTVQINTTNGNFGGTLGSAGYAWSQNYGWIKFDCTDPNTCVNTDWRPATTTPPGGGTTGGGTTGGGPTGGGLPPGVVQTGTVTVQVSDVVCDTDGSMPHWGATGNANITATTGANWVANSKGHCHLSSGQSYQWAIQGVPNPDIAIGPATTYNTFGPTDGNGNTGFTIPFSPSITQYHLREVMQSQYIPFTFEINGNNNNKVSAEFYCETDGRNYDNYDWIYSPQEGATYHCVSFNTTNPSLVIPGEPVTPPTKPTTPTTPTSPTVPVTGGTTPNQPGTPPGGTTPENPPLTTEPPNGPAQSTDEPPFDGGLQLPPQIGETLGNIISTIAGAAGEILSGAKSLVAVTLDAARTDTGSAFTKILTGVGLVATLLFASPFALAELALLPLRLWNLLLIIFGFKKRNRPWGTVYDSVTKQPIDPAYVMLMDLAGNEVATSITDIDGRYGFSVPPGTYKIVANKTNFEFPSKKLFGRTSDELYNDLYFGGEIVLTDEKEVITKNIPLDQLNFDWNEFAKVEQKRLSYYRRSDLAVARISNFFFWLGFIIAIIAVAASHTAYNVIVFLIYVLLFIIRQYNREFKPKGSISDSATGDPLPFAILHVLSIATGQEITHKVADRTGSYYCLLPNGTYQVVIDRKNADATYTKLPVAESVTVKKGILQKAFKV